MKITFTSVVNKHCDDFKLAELSTNNSKCLIFTQCLISVKHAGIRRRVINKLENEPDITLQQVAEDCQRLVSIREDSKNIEQSGIAHIKKIHQRKVKKGQQKIIQLLCCQDHVSGVVNYTGTKIVILKTKTSFGKSTKSDKPECRNIRKLYRSSNM